MFRWTQGAEKITLYFLGFLLFVNILAWIAVFEFSKPEILEVFFFDIGQGDAVFIETSQGHQILIDGGPGSKILEKLSQEIPFYDRSLDLVVLTHPEEDHLGGLIEVLKRYRVDYVLWTGVLRDTYTFQEWQEVLQKVEAEIKIARAGQKIIAGEVVLWVLYPLESLNGQEFKDSNDTSIVAKLSFGKSHFLFTGDIYQSGEEELMNKKVGLDSDVLKVAHHGSKSSSSEEFIQEVSPEIAVIQVGKHNPYGHPHPEVLERLKRYGVEVLRTDEDGDIKIVSDRNYINIEN